MLNEEQKKRAERLGEKVKAVNGTIVEAEDTLADFAFIEVKMPIVTVGENPKENHFLFWDQKVKRILVEDNGERKHLSGAPLSARITLLPLLPALIEKALKDMEAGLVDVEPAEGEENA